MLTMLLAGCSSESLDISMNTMAQYKATVTKMKEEDSAKFAEWEKQFPANESSSVEESEETVPEESIESETEEADEADEASTESSAEE